MITRNTVIELRKESSLGNTFQNNLSENKKLIGDAIYYVLSDKIYDLYLNQINGNL